LTLTGMTLTNGYTSVRRSGPQPELWRAQCHRLFFVNNKAGSRWRAIDTNGPVSIVGSAFIGNRALGLCPTPSPTTPAPAMRAIYVYGSDQLKVSDSTFNGISQTRRRSDLFHGRSAEIKDAVFAGTWCRTCTRLGADSLKGGGAILNEPDASMSSSASPLTLT